MVPAWLETNRAEPVAGMFSAPRTSTRNQVCASQRMAGRNNAVVNCGSKPNSSTA